MKLVGKEHYNYCRQYVINTNGFRTITMTK